MTFQIPSIPAGSQLGGAGTAANHAQAPAQPQAQVPYQAPVAPVAPQAQHAPQYPQGYLGYQAPTQPYGYQPNPQVTAQAPQAKQAQQAPQAPAQSPLAPAAQVEQAPLTPEQALLLQAQGVVAQQPQAQSPTAVPQAPEQAQAPVDVPMGANYLETSVNHLTAELNISHDKFDEAIADALKYGDANLIKLDALGQISPEQQARAKALAQAVVQHTQAEVARVTQEVHAIAGGAEQWNQAVGAFNANAPKHLQKYAGYLAENGEAAEAAKMVLEFVRGNGLINHAAQPAVYGSAGHAQVGQALSRDEYVAEIAKLEREVGNQSWASPSVKARIDDLDRRRALGRQLGR